MVRQNRHRVTKVIVNRRELESSAIVGDSPVGENDDSLGEHPSKPEHVQFRLNS